jgi:hypothetical protein
MVQKLDEAGEKMTTDEGDPVGAYRQRVDRRHEPLHGLFTTKEFNEALESFDRVMNQLTGALNGVSAAGTLYLKGVGWIKMAKVGLNPYSWGLNTIGGVALRLGAGGVNPKHYTNAIAAVLLGSRPLGPNPSPAQKKARETYLLASQAGLIGQGVLLGDIQEAFGRTDREPFRRAVTSIREILEDPKGGGSWVRLKNALMDLVQLPGNLGIRLMDDAFRLSAFLDEFDLAQAAFPTMSRTEQVDWASDRASNLYQTYDRLPRILRDMSRVGVLNTFVSFKLELFRNAYHIARYAAQGLASGNPALRKDGALKAAALSAMVLAPYAIAALSKAATDTDDDKVEAFQRWSVPPWDRGEELVILESDGAKFRYVPMGYMLPHYELTRAVNAGWRGANDPNPEIALTKAMQGYLADYFGPGAFAGPLMESIFGYRIGGGKISYAEGAQQVKDQLKYLARAYRPNIGDPLYQSYMGATGQKGTYGREYDLKEVMLKMGGIRARTVDVQAQLPFVMRGFEQRWRNATSYENIAKRRYPSDLNAQAEAKAYAEQTRAELKAQYKQFRNDMTKVLGISQTAFAAAEKEVKMIKDLK